jgi:MtN3 and saliva related transmembrane protein
MSLMHRSADEMVAPDGGPMAMPLHEIIGFVAGFGTTFAAMPDLVAMLRRRSCEGMNPTMAAIMGTFQILWVYYGILVDSRPVIVWNTIAVAINFLVVGAYVYFAHSRQPQAGMVNHSAAGESRKRPLGK